MKNNNTETKPAENLTFIGNYDADEAVEIFSNSELYFYEFWPADDGTYDVYRGEHAD